MRKTALLIFLLLIWGCTSAPIPAYLQDTKPYIKRFYTNYEQILLATKEALKELGWEIEQELDAAVYEHYTVTELNEKDYLLMTNLRSTPLFLGTRYAKMNIYIRAKENISEVEIRYVTITALPFRNIETYSNDSAVRRIFERIESQLAKQ